MKRETWKTFRDEGMLWWLNRILHTSVLSSTSTTMDQPNPKCGASPQQTIRQEWVTYCGRVA